MWAFPFTNSFNDLYNNDNSRSSLLSWKCSPEFQTGPPAVHQLRCLTHVHYSVPKTCCLLLPPSPGSVPPNVSLDHLPSGTHTPCVSTPLKCEQLNSREFFFLFIGGVCLLSVHQGPRQRDAIFIVASKVTLCMDVQAANKGTESRCGLQPMVC